jgi:molybdopterin-guanine dinucleotide biosynthesis protein
MSTRSVADIRNVCLVGHSGSGKTTLTERLLLSTGLIQADGNGGGREHGRTGRTRRSTTSTRCRPRWCTCRPRGAHDQPDRYAGAGGLSGARDGVFPAVETVAVVVDATRGNRADDAADDGHRPGAASAADDRREQDRRHAGGPGVAGAVDPRDVRPECLPINLPLADRSDVINVFEHEERRGRRDVVRSASTRRTSDRRAGDRGDED